MDLKAKLAYGLAVALALNGCTPVRTKPALSQTTTLHYRLPVLTPVESNKQDQEKDGIRISVAPYSYAPIQAVHRDYRLIPTPVIVNHRYPAEMREMPSITITPKELRFKVKIYNRLEHVLRLAGTVVSFQVAGQTKTVDKARYEDFLNGIILPRQEMEYEIAGSDVDELQDKVTIALLLYDIVTATDAAGNPMKRSNFEFFYTLSMQDKQQQAPVSLRNVALTQGAAQLLIRRGAGGHEWVSMPELEPSMPTPAVR